MCTVTDETAWFRSTTRWSGMYPRAQVTQNAQSESNLFGGPIYSRAPALEAIAALVDGGGGASAFSFATARVSMLGEKAVNAGWQAQEEVR